MKKTLILSALFFSFSFNNAYAIDLDSLRREFSPYIERFQSFLDQASQLRAVDVARGQEITLDQCRDIIRKIEGNYSLSPYLVEFQGGRAFAFTCGDGTDKRFFGPVQVKTGFGLDAAYALRIEVTQFNNDWHLVTLLDSQYRLLEQTQTVLVGHTAVIDQYRVHSTDAAGNTYHNIYFADSKKPWATQVVSLADGSSPLLKQEYRMKDPGTPWYNDTPFIARTYTIAVGSDWNRYDLLLPLSEMGGFYIYGTKVYDHSSLSHVLGLFYENGKEVCANGAVFKKESRLAKELLPNTQSYYDCQNQRW